MSCHEAEVASCSESLHGEQAVVAGEICWLMLLAALEHNAACKTQEAAQYQQLPSNASLAHVLESMMLTWHSLKPSSFQFPATLGFHRLLIARACQWCAAAASLIGTVTSR